ncbi:MAG: phospholipid/cholesterol/gamma-HCH transport system substrate-binding protein [Pseudonocardiales bacterium]|nr:phospholipid/cholesterol/gamma-HCH transport system substrate-binding protein [Pseudonocardiales bacterium]
MVRESTGAVVKRRVQGVLMLGLVAGLIALSIAFYNKVFTDTVTVTLRADHTGNELLIDSDVKERGVIVGSVKSVTSEGDGAIVKLALFPDRVKDIPKNVKAQILPKTLFGEQYVALVAPADPAPPIAAGDVIPQDRSKGALETQQVLGDILPLLNAVQPAQLNATLTALAEALRNRGDELGQTLVNFDRYLKIINPHTKQLVDDLSKLGQVALEYNSLAPDIFATLQNLQVSAKTIIDRRDALDSLLANGTDASTVLQGFLNDNEQRIIRVTGQTDAVYGLLDQYSPEFTCLFAGINQLFDLESTAIYDNRIHLGVIVNGNNLGPYKKNAKVNDTPTLVTGFGPNCFGLPDNPTPTDANGRFQVPEKFRCLRDGVNGGALTREAENPNCSPKTNSSLNSPEEDAMVNTIVAMQLKTTPDKVSGVATLLGAPLLRGRQVTIK